jgi:hypothetical protein
VCDALGVATFSRELGVLRSTGVKLDQEGARHESDYGLSILPTSLHIARLAQFGRDGLYGRAFEPQYWLPPIFSPSSD